MLRPLTVLIACQALGGLLAHLLRLPISGAVLGMVLLFVSLAVMRRVPQDLDHTTSRLLDVLPLLFVPAAVGVIAYLPLLRREWLPLGAALVGSALATLVVTWLTMAFFHRLVDGAVRREAPR